MNTKIKDIIEKACEGILPGVEEIRALLEISLCTEESFYIQYRGRQLSEEACCGKAEVHGQVGVNSGPCSCNCAFCSFAARNKIFHEQWSAPLESIIEQSLELEKAGANAVYLMATANFDFHRYLEIGKIVRRELPGEIPLIANVADFDESGAADLKKAGFTGVYHAVRIGEGEVTRIKIKERLRTFEAAAKAGLLLGTCVEPLGPEHTNDEIIEKVIMAREANPVFSGAARRITIPGTMLEPHGMIGETRMAHILAVVRLATGIEVKGNCTHEPNVIGAAAGANLLWAESGSNPRDTVNTTEKNRGFDVEKCRGILMDAGWQILEGPSKFFLG